MWSWNCLRRGLWSSKWNTKQTAAVVRNNNEETLRLIVVAAAAEEEEDTVVMQPAMPLRDTLTPLEYLVYTSQWQLFWGCFFLQQQQQQVFCSAWYTFLDPEHTEMVATLYLMDWLFHRHRRIVIDVQQTLENLQECCRLLNPEFDWEQHVLQPLQCKRRLLQDMGLPDDIQEVIWNDHVQTGIVYEAIMKCVMEIVEAFFEDGLSQVALHGR